MSLPPGGDMNYCFKKTIFLPFTVMNYGVKAVKRMKSIIHKCTGWGAGGGSWLSVCL